MYADHRTGSIDRAVAETHRRRERQGIYNREHGIEPRTILRDIHGPLVAMSRLDYSDRLLPGALEVADAEEIPLAQRIGRLEKEMKEAAKRLEFEEAAALRDKLRELRELQIYTG
jgi:excinuclease ABC subunit B